MTAADWFEHAFFDTPERDSVDGGTTSTGPLWHGVSVRWGHSMQTMCSYHGMFPAKVAHYFIQRYSRPGDIVLDPFSGRGTVPLQARAEGRVAICNDLNPLAYVLSRAKIDPPPWDGVQDFLTGLEKDYKRSRAGEPRCTCRHPHALSPEHAAADLLRPRTPAQQAHHGLVAGRAHDRRCAGGHYAWIASAGRHLAVPEHQHAEHLQHVADVRAELHPRERTRQARPGCLRMPP